MMLIFASALYADDLSVKMKELGFIEASPPVQGSNEWSDANRSHPAYIVEITEDGLSVGKSRKKHQTQYGNYFESKKVKYIGIDKGEWGGGLYLNEYNEDSKPFLTGNIRALVPIGRDLYIIEGLAHMGYNGGSIYAIRDFETPSTPEKITLLSSAPEAVLVESTRGRTQILIVSHDGLMVFTPDDQLEIIHHDTFWGSLYPSSVVKFWDYYLIGIRSGVVATTISPLGANEIRYFKPEIHNQSQ